MPSSVSIAEVAAGTLKDSAAYFKTAVNGVLSGTDNFLNGSLGSEVNVILKETFWVAIFAKFVEKFWSLRLGFGLSLCQNSLFMDSLCLE